jgi:uncharacterized protein (DUF2147 family)
VKKLLVLAATLMVASSAHAGNSVSFEINGHKVRIEAPRNCDQLSCIQISAAGLSGSGFDFKGFGSKRFDDDDDVAPAKSAPAPVQAAAPPAGPAATAAPVAAPATVATAAPALAPNDVAIAPASAAVSAPAPRPAPVASAPAPSPTTPLGVWATEENKGNVRIEQCGSNLCGYAEKTGEKILINMMPQDHKWTGQIHDPDSGRNYDSTIAMKGTDTLKVQGCAFGGMFCGGQVWKRVS